jgi:hypothetical protein
MVAEVEIGKLKRVWKYGFSHSRSYSHNSFVTQDPNRVHTEAYILEIILVARKSLFTNRQFNMCCSKNMSTVSS